MRKIQVTTGTYWVEIPQADLYVLCGCPADSVKHLMKLGLIVSVEKDGHTYETGPNAILLSDISIQNGAFSNLAEFPVLQILYRQGLLIPGHPNNDGSRPLLIGSQDQIDAQSLYIFRGNYGLSSVEELMKTGLSESTARDLMRLKLKFAFGAIKNTEELIEPRVLGNKPVELRNGVSIRRIDVNQFEFEYQGDRLTVDLNLKSSEQYAVPYQLGDFEISRQYFSVVHTGEGDGWDINRPCMSSLLTYQGKIYLIDVGPNIHASLTALGIGINEIEGVFHTHCHDDHFCGLTTLMRTDHRIKYFATPVVRAAVVKKLCALTSLEEAEFQHYFDVRDLEYETWNTIGGLEVRPFISPHPVETNIFFFRSLGQAGYKTYAHLGDIISFDILKEMIVENEEEPGISHDYFKKVKKELLTPVDLKKIDIGGGMIHGRAEDFKRDASNKILLCHIPRTLSNTEKEIGSSASFGIQDVLIAARQDYGIDSARRYLCEYFQDVPEHAIQLLMNCPVEAYNAGSLLIRTDTYTEDIYLVLNGVLEYIDAASNRSHTLSVGSLIGEYARLMNQPSPVTYRAASYSRVLRIPGELFIEFVKKYDLVDQVKQTYTRKTAIQNTWLFGEMISFPIQNRIAQSMTHQMYATGAELSLELSKQLGMVMSGTMRVSQIGHRLPSAALSLGPGDFFGEETVLRLLGSTYAIEVVQPCSIATIPADILNPIPIVRWKLMETLRRRRM